MNFPRRLSPGDYNAAMSPTPLQNSQRVFKGVRFDVHAVTLLGRDGQTHRREVVVHPGAVVLLPLLDDKTVVLIRNERFAVGQTLWELPAGTLEPEEGPDICAARELEEETGYRAAEIVKLTDFYSSPGICTERMYAYLARHLTYVGQSLDQGEQITPEPIALAKAMTMIREGEIRDGKTIATLLYYHAFGG